MQMTDKDKQLLALMQKNARESVASLARQLGVSRTALQERIQRLETNGIIDGYSVRLGANVNRSPIQCFTFAALNNKNFPDVIKQLKILPAVQAVHSISGDWDLIIHICTDTLEKLNAEINKINEMMGIVRTTSNIVMETKFNRGAHL